MISSIRAIVCCATASVEYAGIFVTAMPRSAAACTSILLYPVAVQPMYFSWGLFSISSRVMGHLLVMRISLPVSRESALSSAVESKMVSLSHRALLMKFLPFAYAHGDDLEAREKVHNASCLAGMAFNKVGLGISHSIAHTIGGKFHLSHGRSNAIVLPHVIDYNAHLDGPEETVCARKYQRMAKLIGLPYSNVPLAVGSLIRKIREMERLFGIPENLKKAGIKHEDLLMRKDEMIHDALADTCTKTNPRETGAADIEGILKKVGPL